MAVDLNLIEDIRSSSRTMVRELGFMRNTLAGTEYSASAVHTLLELSTRKSMTAAQLVQALGLEKSSVSRMVSKLIDAGEVAEAASADDARFKRLLLTKQGERTVAKIHAYGKMQVTTAIEGLTHVEQAAIARGLNAYANALCSSRAAANEAIRPRIEILSGYQPGVIGRVTEMHAAFYAQHSGFGQFFESQVASGMAEFAGRLEASCNDIWVAMQNGRIVGSVAIDGQDLGGNNAHLRWFILDEGCRGGGAGRQLLTKALAFCDSHGFDTTQLWTFKGLDAARRLYESFDFALVNEEQGEQWGSAVIEQQFARLAGRSA